MRRRLFALLVVAALAGLAAGVAGNARAEKERVGARIPALPATRDAACPLPAQWRPAFEAAARDTSLPLALLVAVGRVESNLRADAVSSAGARGLLQVMPATAAELGLDAATPHANVLAGARYLRGLMKRFGSTDLALAAYNAGPSAVESAGGAPTTATLTYVANVTALWHRLRGCS